jgi:N-acetyl-gamma-glutamyl-phosphate reductase
MAARVFIDGEAGTTGLMIRERLAARPDIELLAIAPEARKNAQARRERLNAADVVILCLPDAAARQAMALIDNPTVRVLDASTAHRTTAGWTYGFAEMGPGQRQAIAGSTRVANPGCYATAFIALVRPLVSGGLIPETWPISVNAVSGYSGGGRAMIAEFESDPESRGARPPFRAYALTLGHKHLPEMRHYAGLAEAPLFTPSVAAFFNGMIVEVPLTLKALPGAPSVADLRGALVRAYAGEPFVEVVGERELAGLVGLDPTVLNGTNRMALHVFGSDDGQQARLVAVLDNLGKGAAGAAMQNLNLMLGVAEAFGL